MSDDDTDFREWDAAYVLGALSAQDRKRYEQYLAINAPHAAAELAGLPGILKSLTPDDAMALLRPINDIHLQDRTHQVATLQSLAHSVNRRRRRIRTRLITFSCAAAAVLIAGSLFVGTQVAPNTSPHTAASSSPNAEPAGQPMSALHANTITANLRVTPKQWGTLLSWNCRYLNNWTTGTKNLDMVVTTTSGTETVVATWSASGTHAADLAAATSITAAEIRTITIRPEGETTPLLQANP